jgi:hypothetical protein
MDRAVIASLAKELLRKRQKIRFNGRICLSKIFQDAMVNLPPDQNDRRDRDQILSFDELLAVVLALLGIGTILWWSTSRDRNFFVDNDLLPPAAQSLLERGQDAVGLEESDSAFVPFSGDRSARPDERGLAARESARPDNGLPSLAATSGATRTSAITAPDPTEMEPAVEPEAVTPEPLAESPEAATSPPLDISDVPEDHWAYPFIKDMYDQGLLPDFPSGQFQPDKELTRAELASLMNQAFVADPVEREPFNFADVGSGYWATDAIDQVVERGFMSGYPDNEFRPDQLVPRYQVLVSLATGLDLANPDNVDQTLQRLGSLEGLPNWARPKVAASAQNGLIVNHPDPSQLNPNEPATRAEIVAMIHQALVKEGRLEAIESEFVVPGQ